MGSVDDVLEHHGVKGMKWGMHLFGGSSSGGRFTRGSKHIVPPVSQDHKTATTARSKPLSQLSNNELRDLLTRMELEQRYSRLTAEAPPPATASKLSKGRIFATKLLLDIGKEQVTRVAKTSASVRVENLLEAKGHADIANRLKPKKKK